MTSETNTKLAGEIVFESSVMKREKTIREANDGETIVDAIIVHNVMKNKEEIFTQQSEFIAEFRRRLDLVARFD
jgi:hypothetical protein